MTIAWSYSRYECYSQCAAKYKYRYIDKVEEPKSKSLERGIATHEKLASYLTKKTDKLEENLVISPALTALLGEAREMPVEVEQKWAFDKDWNTTDWFDSSTHFRCVPDVLIRYGDGTALVADHKTGRAYPTHKQQLELFALATFKKYPDIQTIDVRLWYLDEMDKWQTAGVHKRSNMEDVDAAWKARTRGMFTDTEFTPNPSQGCKWCAFSRSKGGPCKY